ncbi:DNA ligase 1-like [Harmonia axyridis]|uniref:DNA ligase 1-like n=1 Tax=Harmonia axyridis TaxID=115357 RepID=UPI001E277258|nr:DNA ligase 1-like [Harmonia axyridis]XP_045471407.1 DNA ligase 1-like [Harmonia axyridis]XP_045471432.1 DNA ligase 1-like [Harmonia axyridis]
MSPINNKSDMQKNQSSVEIEKRRRYKKKILNLAASKMKNSKEMLASTEMRQNIHFALYKEALEQLYGKEIVERKNKELDDKEKKEKEENKVKERKLTEKIAVSSALVKAKLYKLLLNKIVSGDLNKEYANREIKKLSLRNKPIIKYRHLKFIPTVPKRAIDTESGSDMNI